MYVNLNKYVSMQIWNEKNGRQEKWKTRKKENGKRGKWKRRKVENLGNTFFCKPTEVHLSRTASPTENCEIDQQIFPANAILLDLKFT